MSASDAELEGLERSYRKWALRFCAEYAAEVRARMEAPPPPKSGKRRWSNVDLAALFARIEASEEIAKRIKGEA